MANVIDIAKGLGKEKGAGGKYHCFNKSAHKNGDAHPSLSITEKGFNCFVCGVHGNGIDLVEGEKNIDKNSAIQWLKDHGYWDNNYSKTNQTTTNKPTQKADGKLKYDLRFIPEYKGDRFARWDVELKHLKKPIADDLKLIKEQINKKYSVQSFEFLKCLYYDNGYIKAIAFPIELPTIFNPNNHKQYIWVEGRTDYLTLFELELFKDYAIAFQKTKQEKIILPEGTHYFLLDTDVKPEGLKSRITVENDNCKGYYSYIPTVKDVSELYYNCNSKEEAIGKIKLILDYAEMLTLPKIFNSISANELSKMDISPLQYIVEDLLPVGYSMLAGAPKAGKSFFALNLAVAVANGYKFANFFKTNKSDVLYFSLEDSERRLKCRINQYLQSEAPEDRIAPKNLHFVLKNRLSYEELISTLRKKLDCSNNIKLVVIDTLAKILPMTKSNNNAYKQEYTFGEKLFEIATDYDISILSLHHTRKAKSEDNNVFNEISGTNGTIAAVDTMYILKRGNDMNKLFVTGRDVESNTYAFEFLKEFMQWNCLGLSEIVTSSNELNKIYNLLDEQGSFSANEMAKILKLDSGNVYKSLKKLIDRGVKKYPGYGGKYYIDKS